MYLVAINYSAATQMRPAGGGGGFPHGLRFKYHLGMLRIYPLETRHAHTHTHPHTQREADLRDRVREPAHHQQPTTSMFWVNALRGSDWFHPADQVERYSAVKWHSSTLLNNADFFLFGDLLNKHFPFKLPNKYPHNLYSPAGVPHTAEPQAPSYFNQTCLFQPIEIKRSHVGTYPKLILRRPGPDYLIN